MPDDQTTQTNERQTTEAADLRELREAVLHMTQRLRDLGLARIADVGHELSETSDEVLREGRRVLAEFEKRTGAVEKQVERSLREHPAGWAAGLLGVVGFGLALGLLLRNRD